MTICSIRVREMSCLDATNGQLMPRFHYTCRVNTESEFSLGRSREAVTVGRQSGSTCRSNITSWDHRLYSDSSHDKTSGRCRAIITRLSIDRRETPLRPTPLRESERSFSPPRKCSEHKDRKFAKNSNCRDVDAKTCARVRACA